MMVLKYLRHGKLLEVSHSTMFQNHVGRIRWSQKRGKFYKNNETVLCIVRKENEIKQIHLVLRLCFFEEESWPAVYI